MSNTYTPSVALATPAYNDPNWDVPLRSNNTLLDGLTAIGGLGVALTEQPSASLNVKIAAGTFRKSDGTLVSYAGTSSQAMTLSQTNYLYLTDSGTLTVNTTGFPASTFHVRIAIVVAGATTITSITDARVQCSSSGANQNTIYLALAGGTFSDASGVVAVHTGTTHGTNLAATSSELLGFWGATPVAQPANTTDILAGLTGVGLRASGGNPPLNMGSGTLTCGAANINGTATLSGTVNITDGFNIVLGTTAGTEFGTGTTQKLSFYGVTPTAQQSGSSQAAIGSYTSSTLTNSTTGTPSTTINDVGGSFSQTTLDNNFASLTVQINDIVTDLGTVKTLVNALRSALVNLGLIKGSA